MPQIFDRKNLMDGRHLTLIRLPFNNSNEKIDGLIFCQNFPCQIFAL